MEKRRVFFYNGSLRMGGIERVLTEVLQNIDITKIKIDLIIEDGIKTLNVFEKDIPKEIDIYYLKPESLIKKTDYFRKKKNQIFYKIIYNLMMSYESYLKRRNLKKIFKNREYDVAIDFDMGLSKYIDLIRARKKIAWIHASIEHWYEKENKIKRLGRRLEKYDKIITICDEMKEKTMKLYPFLRSKLGRIYNPFDFERIKKMSDQEVKDDRITEEYIITVSRLTLHQKDFETLIKAFKNVKIRYKIKEKLYILGDGPDKEKIQKMIMNENMQNDIILIGNVNNPYPWIKKAKLLVHSSKYEGLPTVLIEALCLNKIVISSNCPTGPIEILENGEIGYLYNVGDCKKLSEIIIEKLRDDTINKKLIQEKIRKYDKKVIIQKYEKLIYE